MPYRKIMLIHIGMVSLFSISSARKLYFLQKHIFKNHFLKNHFYNMESTHTRLVCAEPFINTDCI